MIKNKKPFIFLCTAMSLDGKLSNYKKEQIEIAENDDKEMMYNCRIIADAVMVGGNTLLQDDPKLLVKTRERQKKRIKLGKPPEPIKVAVISDASELKTKGDFFDVGDTEKIIFTTNKTSKKKIKEIEKKAKVHVFKTEHIDLKKVMSVLYDYGVKNLMVEGGGTLIFHLLKEKLVDEMYLKIGNLLIGGKDAISFVEGKGFDKKNVKKVEFIKLIKKPNYFILRAKIIY